MTFRAMLAYLDKDDRMTLSGIARNLLRGGKQAEEVADEIAALLDVLLPLDVFFAGPIGSTLELADGVLLKLLARGIVRTAQKKLERAEKNTLP